MCKNMYECVPVYNSWSSATEGLNNNGDQGDGARTFGIFSRTMMLMAQKRKTPSVKTKRRIPSLM